MEPLPSDRRTTLEDRDKPLISDDVASERPHRSPPTTPTGGRRSSETNRLLNEGYRELEGILERVASQTNMTAQQVAEAWHKSTSRVINVPNHWNLYQAYFKANEMEERARFPSAVEGQATPTLISRCYKQFVSDENEKWKEILESFECAELTKTQEHTMGDRISKFNAVFRKLSHTMDAAAAKHGFQSSLVMCGNIVNEDNMGRVHTTDAANGFWETRCKADEDTIIGHLKAHVLMSNTISLEVVDEAWGENVDIRANNASKKNSDAAKTACNARASPGPSVAPLPAIQDDTDLAGTLKTLLIELIRACGVDVSKLQGSNFPWKTLLGFLASNGLVIEGYPYGILMPGQRRNEATCTKGINDLSLPDKRQLIRHMQDKVLTVRRVRDIHEHRALQGNNSPVVTEEAPPASAPDAYGRRMFSNGQVDRKGPSRLGASAAAVRVKQTSHSRESGHMKESESTDIESPSRHSAAELQHELPKPGHGGRKIKRKAFADLEEHVTKVPALGGNDGPVGREIPKREIPKGKKRGKSPIANGKRRTKKAPSKEFISSSEDESEAELPVSHSSLSDDSLPAPRPRPRLVGHVLPSSGTEDPFRIAGTAVTSTEEAVAKSLRKSVDGPPQSFAPPSTPSPKRHNVPHLSPREHSAPAIPPGQSHATLGSQSTPTEASILVATSPIPSALSPGTTPDFRPHPLPDGHLKNSLAPLRAHQSSAILTPPFPAPSPNSSIPATTASNLPILSALSPGTTADFHPHPHPLPDGHLQNSLAPLRAHQLPAIQGLLAPPLPVPSPSPSIPAAPVSNLPIPSAPLPGTTADFYLHHHPLPDGHLQNSLAPLRAHQSPTIQGLLAPPLPVPSPNSSIPIPPSSNLPHSITPVRYLEPYPALPSATQNQGHARPLMSQDPYGVQGGFCDPLRQAHHTQGCHNPTAYTQQQGYPGDCGINAIGFDSRRAIYQDTAGNVHYRDSGHGSTGMYQHDSRDPYNFAPGYGGSREGYIATYNPQGIPYQQAQIIAGVAQDPLPQIPAPQRPL